MGELRGGWAGGCAGGDEKKEGIYGSTSKNKL